LHRAHLPPVFIPHNKRQCHGRVALCSSGCFFVRLPDYCSPWTTLHPSECRFFLLNLLNTLIHSGPNVFSATNPSSPACFTFFPPASCLLTTSLIPASFSLHLRRNCIPPAFLSDVSVSLECRLFSSPSPLSIERPIKDCWSSWDYVGLFGGPGWSNFLEIPTPYMVSFFFPLRFATEQSGRSSVFLSADLLSVSLQRFLM